MNNFAVIIQNANHNTGNKCSILTHSEIRIPGFFLVFSGAANNIYLAKYALILMSRPEKWTL
jgi:hypothetical protein